jgi:hypothetical protein
MMAVHYGRPSSISLRKLLTSPYFSPGGEKYGLVKRLAHQVKCFFSSGRKLSVSYVDAAGLRIF